MLICITLHIYANLILFVKTNEEPFGLLRIIIKEVENEFKIIILKKMSK